MRILPAIAYCQKYSQEHLIEGVKREDPSLLEDFRSLNWKTFERQLHAIHSHTKHEKVSPLTKALVATQHHFASEMQHKSYGCLVMAGGMGSRLCADRPKALLPASPLLGKTLLQILCEKVFAFKTSYHAAVVVGIMTSRVTDAAIREYVQQHDYFGLGAENICFFQQSSLPLIDEAGHIIVDNGRIAFGPDGNGSIFSSFARSSLLAEWEQRGVEAISIVSIDNPLIDPFHPSLVIPVLHGREMTAAATNTKSVHEAVGLFALKNKRIAVVEYSELAPALPKDGLVNISYFVTTVAFARKAARHRLPLHVAKKQYNGQWAWKCEYFIFDHLAKVREVDVVCLEREKYFAPIKNVSGVDSLKTAQEQILARDMLRCAELTGCQPSKPVELPQEAFYPQSSGFSSEFLTSLCSLA